MLIFFPVFKKSRLAWKTFWTSYVHAMVSPFVVLQKCCKKGHNSIFEVVSVLKKGFNMSYVHVLKVRVLSNIDR